MIKAGVLLGKNATSGFGDGGVDTTAETLVGRNDDEQLAL